jgi:hypothetical protein
VECGDLRFRLTCQPAAEFKGEAVVCAAEVGDQNALRPEEAPIDKDRGIEKAQNSRPSAAIPAPAAWRVGQHFKTIFRKQTRRG